MTVSSDEFLKTFGKIGLLSFGGPAGQIALMHKILVEEKNWLEEKRFLHALNFCMLLPGPEAMQLATYSGWLLKGVKGGLVAGSLFVLPGALVLLGLSTLYIYLGDIPIVEGMLFGLKAAVLAIVLQALVKVSKRALKSWLSYILAFFALLGLAIFKIPFPIVILFAATIGLLFPAVFADYSEEAIEATSADPLQHVFKVLIAALAFWLIPLGLLIYVIAPESVFAEEALFFSKAAVVTFGGAYAVLAYVGQQAVEVYYWLQPQEMLTGLGLAETTPGPLILVLVFVGFVGAFRDSGLLDPLLSGFLGAIVTLWVTFVPCFIWIFMGAPFLETLRGNHRLNGAFAAITAAVVGVIANLSIWFGFHVLFERHGFTTILSRKIELPVLETLDWRAMMIAVLAALYLLRGGGLFPTLLGATGIGIGFTFLG